MTSSGRFRRGGFAGAEGPMPNLSGQAAALAETALRYCEGLARVRIG